MGTVKVVSVFNYFPGMNWISQNGFGRALGKRFSALVFCTGDIKMLANTGSKMVSLYTLNISFTVLASSGITTNLPLSVL